MNFGTHDVRLFRQCATRTIVIALALGVVLCAAGLGQDANDASSQAITLFNSGQDAHEKGDLSTAIQNYEKALKLLPEFPEAELQRANAYLALGKLDAAEAAYRRAAELREDWSLAIANLGTVLVRRSKFSEAEKYLTKAIELDELNFPAYAAMTELRLRTKADTAVLNSLLARITVLTAKANPTASVWASRAALEVALGDRKSAKVSAARAVELDRNSQFALSTSADIALSENDPTAAEGSVKRLETIAPQSEATKRLRARLHAAQGRSDAAVQLLTSIEHPEPETVELRTRILASTSTNAAELEKQLAADPKSALLLVRVCSAFRVTDPAKALDYCRRASEAAPQDVEPVVGYAAALVQAKRYEEAVAVLRKVLTIAPDNSTVHANLGTALFQLKRYAEAKSEFRWLTERQPGQAAAYYFLAIAHDRLSEFADAAANYQEFLRLADPESSKMEIERVNLRLPIIRNLLKDGKGKKRG